MKFKVQLMMLLRTDSSIRLILWLIMCLFLYLLLPNSTKIVPSLVTTLDLSTTYSENPQQLMDLPNFDYQIKQAPCKCHIQTLIMVHSSPSNMEKRSIIRQTWGSQSIMSGNTTLGLLFLLGSVKDNDLQGMLLAEQQQHGDLLQGNFMDAYFNLTYKHVMALKWFHTNCERARLLLKVDDDIFVNTPQLLKYSQVSLSDTALSKLLQQPEQLLLCALNAKDPVSRSYNSKWRVSFKEYAGQYYPPFCPGFAVFYSFDVVQRLYSAAQRSSFYRLDDVLVTGLLSKRSNISITNLKPYVLYPDELAELLTGHANRKQFKFLVTWHKMTATQIRQLWQLYGIENATKPAN